ncbi:aldehyde-activating protein [Mesorhizobium sp. NBSH29]|uniref:GFA family protein n=1 Tax=Mesorhizobium sp. NBSH29 TaxID=2654249 RepID=UPI001896764B|nr:GFA family protein [Mesorhizobium sp. NBSH29]QPC88138.1 aldehyde-activating protein [Mesorhizobium sp. NBSH29]
MSKTYRGGCACGAIRYKTDSAPIFQNHCHCGDCRKRSGTGHGSYLTFAKRDGVTVAGKAKIWSVTGDSGNDKLHAFCPTCGAPVYLNFVAMPELIAIHAGSLDNSGQFEPHAVTYAALALDWDKQNPQLTHFQRMPQE